MSATVIRTIHVGVGARGKWPIEVMGADARFEPVALVDLNTVFLAEAQQRLGLADGALFGDLESALRSVDADAVVICTPTRTHASLCRAAFAAGKHVLVEKGMTMDWAEANALVAEAEATGVCFCVGQNYRYNANERAVSALLASPSHPHHPGGIEIVDYVHHRYRPDPRTLDYPYAMVWDMSCHHVDSLSAWLGPVKQVTSHSYNTSWSNYADDANITAFLEYESGAKCHYILTHTATISEWRVTLQGERGALKLYDQPGVRFFARPASQLGASNAELCEQNGVGERSEQGVADAFYAYIADGIEPGISGRNNLQTLAVCELLIRSAREGRTIERVELKWRAAPVAGA